MIAPRLASFAALALLVGVGCQRPVDPYRTGATRLAPEDDPLRCGEGVVAVPYQKAVLYPNDMRASYLYDPPASGPVWVDSHDWGVFLDEAVPPELWVHNLMHGGIVMLVRCPVPDQEDGGVVDGGTGAGGDDCAEAEQVFRDFYAAQPEDKYDEVRMLVTRYPALTTRTAVVAWGFSWSGERPDEALLRCFSAARYGKGPEDVP